MTHIISSTKFKTKLLLLLKPEAKNNNEQKS